MSESRFGITLGANTKMAKNSLDGLSDSFVRISKDGKGADTTINGLANTMGVLKKAASGVVFYKLARTIGKASQAAMDIRESIHLFNVAMGDSAEATGELIGKLSDLSGLDKIGLLDTVGEYNLLARSMGVTSKNAAVLSENTVKLALDLSALTNRDIVKVQEDLRSGLIGQSKTMYKYGVDVTEAALKQQALNMGIKKSVRHMTQAEKMQLRYIVMIKQTGLAHGDFAETINAPANQLRILSSRVVTATRSLGTIFIPMLTKVLPYLNAFVKALNVVFVAMARVFGYDPKINEKIENTGDAFGDATGDLADMKDEADKTGKEVTKLKKKIQQLAGFDELNILGRHEAPEKPKKEKKKKEDFGPIDFDLEGFDSSWENISQTTDKIFDKMMNWMREVQKLARPTTNALSKLWNEGLKELNDFSSQALFDFYEYFLKPVGKWTLSINGLPKLILILNDMLKKIKWNVLNKHLANLFKALAPLAINMGEGLLWFFENVLSPIGVWVGNNIAPLFLEGLTHILEALGEIIKAGKPIWKFLFDYLLRPLVEFTGGVITVFLWGIVKALQGISYILKEYPTATKTLTAFLTAWGLIKVLGLIKSVGGFSAVLGNLPLVGGPLGKIVKSFSAFLPSAPIMLGISAIVIALGVFNNKLRKESPEAVDIFAGGVSNGTKEAVGAFLDLERKGSNALTELAWSGGTLSKAMSDNIKGIYGEMTTSIVAELESKKTKTLKVMTDANGTQIKGAEFFSKETIKITRDTYDNKIKVAQERENRLNEILDISAKNGGKISEAHKKEIAKIQDAMKKDGIKILSASKKEQLIIMDNLKREGGKISAKSAADIVKTSLQRKKDVIREADEEYYNLISIAEDLRKDGTAEAVEAAKEIEAQAEKQRKAAIREAEKMHKDVVEQARLQAGGQARWIDFATGEIRSSWKVMWTDATSWADKVANIIGNIPSEIAKDLRKNGVKMKNAMYNVWQNALEGIVKPANGIIKLANKVMGLFGMKPMSTISWGDVRGSNAGGGSGQTVSPYAKGTSGHKGGHALVNDGRGSNYKELIRFPNGKTIIPEGRNVMIPNMPKGTQVLSGDETKKITAYKKGTGGFWDSVKSAAGGIWNWAKKPLDFVKRALSSDIDYGGVSGIGLQMAKGLTNKVTNPMSEWLGGLFSNNKQHNPATPTNPSQPTTSQGNSTAMGGIGFPNPPFRKTSSFGRRVHPIFGVGKMHNGVDLAAKSGTPVYAQHGGRVSNAKYTGGYGNMVKITQGASEQIYAHLNTILTSLGSHVPTGRKIGTVGSTGDSTGPHLHYEKRMNGRPIHPGYKKGGFIGELTPFNVAGEAGNEGIVPLEGRHMIPFADAVADRLSEHANKTIKDNNNGNNNIVVKIGERTIVDVLTAEINRQGRINGETLIKI